MTMLIAVLTAILATGAFYSVRPLLEHVMQLPPSVLAFSRPYWLLRGLSLPLQLWSSGMSGILQGYGRMGVNAGISVGVPFLFSRLRKSRLLHSLSSHVTQRRHLHRCAPLLSLHCLSHFLHSAAKQTAAQPLHSHASILPAPCAGQAVLELTFSALVLTAPFLPAGFRTLPSVAYATLAAQATAAAAFTACALALAPLGAPASFSLLRRRRAPPPSRGGGAVASDSSSATATAAFLSPRESLASTLTGLSSTGLSDMFFSDELASPIREPLLTSARLCWTRAVVSLSSLPPCTASLAVLDLSASPVHPSPRKSLSGTGIASCLHGQCAALRASP